MATKWTKPVARDIVVPNSDTPSGSPEVDLVVALDRTGVTFRLKGHRKTGYIPYADLLSKLPK